MRTLTLPLFGLLLCSCVQVDHSHPVSSDRLHDPSLVLALLPGESTLTLQMSDCPTFAGTGLFDGQPLQQTELGGEGTGLFGGLCTHPTWRLPSSMPDEPVTELEVFDAVGRFTFGVRNLASSREPHYPPPGTSAFHWGDPVTIAWTPASDTVTSFELRLVGGGALIPMTGSGDVPIYRDGAFQFHLPPAPAGGPARITDGQLILSIEDAQLGVAHCEPDPRWCLGAILVNRSFTLPMTVE